MKCCIPASLKTQVWSNIVIGTSLFFQQVWGRQPFDADWYMLSDKELQLNSASTNTTDGAFQASIDGIEYAPR